MNEVNKKKAADPVRCPSCGYLNNRPHVAVCPRCNGVIQGAEGCSGCGACRGRV